MWNTGFEDTPFRPRNHEQMTCTSACVLLPITAKPLGALSPWFIGGSVQITLSLPITLVHTQGSYIQHHEDKCVLRWGEALRGLTAIGLCAKKAWGSVRSLFHLVQDEHIDVSFQHHDLGTLRYFVYLDNSGGLLLWGGRYLKSILSQAAKPLMHYEKKS